MQLSKDKLSFVVQKDCVLIKAKAASACSTSLKKNTSYFTECAVLPNHRFRMWNGTKKWPFFHKVKQEAQEAEVTCGRRASSRKNEIPSLTRKRSDGLVSHFA